MSRATQCTGTACDAFVDAPAVRCPDCSIAFVPPPGDVDAVLAITLAEDLAGPIWYLDHEALSEAAHALADVYGWDVDDLLRFIEKPWKWSPERNRWVALGRPDPATLEADALEVDT